MSKASPIHLWELYSRGRVGCVQSSGHADLPSRASDGRHRPARGATTILRRSTTVPQIDAVPTGMSTWRGALRSRPSSCSHSSLTS